MKTRQEKQEEKQEAESSMPLVVNSSLDTGWTGFSLMLVPPALVNSQQQQQQQQQGGEVDLRLAAFG